MLPASHPYLFFVGSFSLGRSRLARCRLIGLLPYRPRVSAESDWLERPANRRCNRSSEDLFVSEISVKLLGSRDRIHPRTLELTHKFRRRPKIKSSAVSVSSSPAPEGRES